MMPIRETCKMSCAIFKNLEISGTSRVSRFKALQKIEEHQNKHVLLSYCHAKKHDSSPTTTMLMECDP